MATLAFLLGLFAIIGQVVFIREFLAILYGNELSIALVFVFWFLGIVTGALSARRMGVKAENAAGISEILVCLMPLAGMIQVAGIRLFRILAGIGPGEYLTIWQALLGFSIFVLPFAFMVGIAFPALSVYAGKIGKTRPGKSPAGLIYWIESGGSLTGGVLFTFILAGRVSSIPIFWMCLSVALVIGAIIRTISPKGSRFGKIIGVLMACLITVAISLGMGHWLDNWTVEQRWASVAPGYTLIENRDSQYQNISVGERHGQYAVYLDGKVSSTFPDPFEVAQHVHLYMNQAEIIQDVLFVGHGLGGEVQSVLGYPVREVVVVFPDPAYEQMVMPLLSEGERRLLEDSRLKIIHMDAGEYLYKRRQMFDLIVLQPPAPATAAFNRFYTRNFFALCQRHLRPGGVLCVGLEGSVNFIGEDVWRYTGTLYRTLQDVFQNVIVSPGTRQIFFASDSDTITLDDGELARRYGARKIKAGDWFTPYHFSSLLPGDRVAWINQKMKEIPREWINTEHRPVLYLHHLKLWDMFSGSHLSDIVDLFRKVELRQMMVMILAGLFLLLSFFALMIRRDKGLRRMNLWMIQLGIFVFGFTGMGLELILLYNFQILFGYLYSMIGLLIACFMLGLTGGAWCAHKVLDLSSAQSFRWRIFWLPAALVVIVLSVAVTFGLHFNRALSAVFIQILAAGALTGLYFPVACNAYSSEGAPVVSTASRMDAMDHMGALAGAGITGVILLPALGVVHAVFFLLFLVILIPVISLFGLLLQATINRNKNL